VDQGRHLQPGIGPRASRLRSVAGVLGRSVHGPREVHRRSTGGRCCPVVGLSFATRAQPRVNVRADLYTHQYYPGGVAPVRHPPATARSWQLSGAGAHVCSDVAIRPGSAQHHAAPPLPGLLYGPARRSMTRHHAPLAQLAEQQTLNLRVRGSSPWRRTNLFPGHARSARLPWCLRLQPGSNASSSNRLHSPPSSSAASGSSAWSSSSCQSVLAIGAAASEGPPAPHGCRRSSSARSGCGQGSPSPPGAARTEQPEGWPPYDGDHAAQPEAGPLCRAVL
jgi:hypothetical protein